MTNCLAYHILTGAHSSLNTSFQRIRILLLVVHIVENLKTNVLVLFKAVPSTLLDLSHYRQIYNFFCLCLAEIDADTEPEPGRQRPWMRMRIRKNDADPTGSGSTDP
jgi:hypothetical protein